MAGWPFCFSDSPEINVVWLWLRGKQLSQNAYFCVQNVNSSFAIIGFRIGLDSVLILYTKNLHLEMPRQIQTFRWKILSLTHCYDIRKTHGFHEISSENNN